MIPIKCVKLTFSIMWIDCCTTIIYGQFENLPMNDSKRFSAKTTHWNGSSWSKKCIIWHLLYKQYNQLGLGLVENVNAVENNLSGKTEEETDVVVGKRTTKTQVKVTNYQTAKLYALIVIQTLVHLEDREVKTWKTVFLAVFLFFFCSARCCPYGR